MIECEDEEVIESTSVAHFGTRSGFFGFTLFQWFGERVCTMSQRFELLPPWIWITQKM